MSATSFEAFHKRIIRANENDNWQRDIARYEQHKETLALAKRLKSERLETTIIESMERIKATYPNVKFD